MSSVDDERPDLPVLREHDVGAVTLFGTSDPRTFLLRAQEAATPLRELVTQAGFVTDIQGREHVKVEGWTTLGGMLGVFPITIWTRRMADPDGWEARVEARTRSGELVGAAEAMCTRDEDMWSHSPVGRRGQTLKARDEHALRSMAQTRATRAALRSPLGFVFGLAGFSTDAPVDDSFEQKQGRRQSSGQSRPDRPSAAQTSELGTLFDELSETQQPELVDADGTNSTVYEDWRSYAKAWCEREFQVSDSTRLSGAQMQALIDHLTDKRIEF